MMIKHTFTIANLILLSLVSFFCVKGCYNALATVQAPTVTDQSDVRGIIPRARFHSQPLSAYAPITTRNLFKTQKKETQKSVEVDLEGMEPTDLNLKLWGTVTGETKNAYAVIEDLKERRQDLFRAGDTIQNATVKLILREKVVLNVGGKDEILEIEKMEANTGRRSVGYRPPIGPTTAFNSRPQRITLNRSQIEDAMQNVTDLMGQIKVRPHFEDGRPDGLQLSSIKPRSIFRRMGLRNGDIITGVDGQQIESVDDALKFYENIRSAANMTVDIKRRGRPRTIEYNIR